jgi:hypothetical protein
MQNRKLRAINLLIGWALLILIPVIFVFFVIVKPLNEANNRLRVIDQGERTMATITSKELGSSEIGDNRDPHAAIDYTFTPLSGQSQTGKYVFSFTTVDDLRVGDKIEIAYDPQAPDINLPVRARNSESTHASPFFLIGFIPLFSILGFFWFFVVKKACKTWRTN